MLTHMTNNNANRPKTHQTENNIELFEIELTKAQLKALSGLLPRGFSLEPVGKNQRNIISLASKKLFTNNLLFKKDKKPVIKKTTKPITENILINKNALRDPGQRKISLAFDDRYPEFESPLATASKVIKPNNPPGRKCYNLLQKLKKHRSVGPFLYPVDVKGLGLVDYYDIVKEPMDLSTAEQKLKNGQYSSINQFGDDIRKIWNNALLYNMEGSSIHFMTLEMRDYFEKLFQEIDDSSSNCAVRDLEKKIEMLSKQINELYQRGPATAYIPEEPPKLNRSVSKASSKNSKLMGKQLTQQEKKNLVQNIKKLSAEHLRGVWDIVSQGMNPTDNGKEELEFDIERLPVHVTRELERYVKNKLSLMNRGKNKAKAKESLGVREIGLPALKQHEGEFEPIGKCEDEVTTQHHSEIGSEGRPGSKDGVNLKDDAESNSSESSFISDSDSDDENKKTKNKHYSKGTNSLQNKQELANFLAGGHGSMLNSFVVK